MQRRDDLQVIWASVMACGLVLIQEYGERFAVMKLVAALCAIVAPAKSSVRAIA